MATYSDIRKRREAVERKFGGANNTESETKKASYITQPTQEEETNKGGLFGGIAYTLSKIGLGAARSVEGISDYIVGGVADLFGADDFADELMKSDWLDYEAADKWYNPSGAMSFVGDVASGVGGMLPSLALTYFTGGAGAPASVAQGLGTAAFGLGAAGQAVSEETKKSGTASGEEWLYGTASGAAEAGIEALSGGIGGTQAGKVLGTQLGKTAVGKVATTFVSEGLEEVASDLLDPALKRITGVDKTATVDWSSLPRTFLVGGTTGAVMGGAGQIANAVKAGGFNNANAVENAQEMSERLSDNNVRQAKGKRLTYTQEDINTVRDRLSKNLQKMDENTRSSFLARNKQIASYFNVDGTVKEFSVSENNMRDLHENSFYSASLQGRESEFEYAPVSKSSDGFENAKQAMKNVELLTNGKTDIVLTDQDILTADGQKANGVYKNGILYLNAKTSSYEKAMFVGAHELAHTLEGTNEYAALGKFIAETIDGNPELQKKYDINRYMAAYANAQSKNYSEETKQYEATTEMYADFIANEILSNVDTVRRLVNRNRNVIVRMLEWVRDAIKRLGMNKEDKEAYNAMKKAEKLLSEALEVGSGGISLDEIEESVQARKQAEAESSNKKQIAEKSAVEATSERYVIKPFNKEGYGFEKNIEIVSKMEPVSILNGDEFVIGQKGLYDSVSDYFATINNNAYNEELGDVELTRRGVKDSVAHGLGEAKAAAFKAVPNIIEQGSVVDYQEKWKGHEYDTAVIAAPIEIAGEEYYAAVIVRRANNKQRFYLHEIEIKKRQTVQTEATTTNSTKELGGLPINSIFEKLRKVNTFDEKIEKNFSGRASLDVDSDGNELSKEQQEYFKDSKVRDKNGNLLVVYHQTDGNFTVFDTQREGAGKRDNETPHGIFLKPTDANIGLKGNKQMRLYVNIANPLELYSREQAQRYWRDNIDGYGDIVDQIYQNDKKYGAEFDEAFLGKRMARREFMSLPKEQRDNLMEEYEAQAEKILDKWTTENTGLDVKAKELIDKYMKESGYDGVHLINDKGSIGRVVETYIALSPEQVKNITNKNPTSNPDIRYSLPINIEEDVKKHYGSTYRWNETGYILKDGTRLDLSGRNEGASGGYRTVDHRDIFDIIDDGDIYGSDAMIEFIHRGNIRVMPESPGVNLQVEPNAEQYRLIQDFVERVGWKEGYFSVDIDNQYGDTIETLTYEGRPSGRKVVSDIKYYFKEGKLPYKSELSSFRYSLDLIDNYTEKQYNDFGWARVNDVLTARENADFRSKYAKIKSGQIRANRTKNGEIIVAVNDGKDTSFGVDNVLVYAKGSLENYKINKIVRINSNNETFLTEARELVYEWERRGIQIKTSELFNLYNAEDYGYDKLMQDRRAGLQDNAQRSRKQDGRRAFGEAPRYSLNVIKSYSQADMKATVQDMEDMFVAVSGIADDYRVDVKNKNRLAKEFSEELNGNAANTNKSVEERARSFVDRVVDNLVITKNREEVAEAEGMIEALRTYYHSMNLSSIKSEILDPADLRLWSGGEKALPWDVILQEIMEQHPQLVREDVGNTDIDTLLNVFETYKRARKVLNESRISVSKAVSNLAEVKRLMARQLSVALEEYGTQYKKERKPTYMTDEEYEERLNQANPITDETVAGIRRVTKEPQKLSKKERIYAVKTKAAEGWLASQIEFTNVQAGIEDAGKNLGLDLKGKVQKARSARAAALNMITNAQMDYKSENVVGKSLTEIFEPIHKRGDDYTSDFYEYILHWHNADRMALERKAKAEMQKLVKADTELSKIVKRKNITETEREAMLRKTANGRRYLSLAEVRNKPVFGDTVTEKDSISRRAELQTKHPEFVKLAKEVWDYNQNLLRRRVDAGLITQEMADELNAMYPHYVPTFRDMDGAPGTGRAGTKNSKYAVEVKKTIKTAKGSNLDILDLSLMMANQTQAVLRAEAINELANELYEGAVAKNDFSDVAVKDVVDLTNPDVDYEAEKPKNNEVVFFKDGKRITMAVSQPVFIGFESFNGVASFNDPVVKSLEKVNDVFKKCVTQWNPLFLIRNAIRDFQEAIFYTKNGIHKYIANLPKAIKAMSGKGKLWQQYLAMGGVSNGYFSNETGIYDRSGKMKKGIKKVAGILSTANEFIEQIPRFNEFMLSVQNGKSFEDALLDAADVTTNFSRGGKITKVMNRTLIPFLNPSVQGWSKLWRTATGRKTARQWTALIVKALAFGLSVGLINDLVNGDDEEYKALRTSDKENYFIIRAGDKFIKIPKGRVVAALGVVAGRTKKFLEGDEHAFDDWLSSVSTMISPVENASRTIFSPFFDIQTNTTWYGGQIESQRLQSLAPSERYDESTSSIAIALGKFLDYSPKKIHYLIDQYSGIFGDVILPATTAKAERDMFSAAFTIDPVLSNGISTDFYDLVDETTYAKNAGDPTAVLKLRYLNEVSNAVSDMYQQKRDIENNSELSDKEKREQTRAMQAVINATLSSAIKGSTDFEQILINIGYETAATALVENVTYQSFTEKQQTSAARKLTDYYYAKAYSKISGGEYSYKYHLYEAAGVEKTSIYLTEIATIEGDKDTSGKTISGSRKKKVQAYIEKLRLSAMQKYILLYLAGYTPSDAGKTQIKRYLKQQGFSNEEIEEVF